MPFVTKAVWRAGAISLLAACAAVSQTNATVPSGTFGMSGQMGGVIGGVATAGSPFVPVTGAPYSGELVSERIQTLADGTHITETIQTTKVYRDSAGRTRTEHQKPLPPGGAAATQVPMFIDISDPVAGYRYTLQQQNHVARRMPWPPTRLQTGVSQPQAAAGASAPQPASASGTQNQTGAKTTRRPRPDMVHEALGTQTIEGIPAEGSRFTTTYPVGFMGNDRPITTVRETWMSPDLKIVVLTKMTDPRSGDSSTKLTNFSQTEPDPALFEVPADYTIEDASQPAAVPR